METVLTVTQLSKKYHKQWALKNVSLSIKKGDIYGLIGRNGAGKTTLLKIMTGLAEQTNGHIQLFNSANQHDYTEKLARTGSVIETPVAYEQLTAEQNLTYYCKLRGVVNKKDIQDTLELVGLKDIGKKKYKHFSLGMKQKLGIAIALISKPDLLILDEPINGLDPISIVEFRDLLLTLNREHSMTIIISSHILAELYHVANRFGIIHEGELLEEISKEHFQENCRDIVHIVLDDPYHASHILKDYFHCDFKVVSQNEINIYDFQGDTAEILQQLITAGIRVNSLHTVDTDLETYFTQLIEAKSSITQPTNSWEEFT